MFQMSVHPRRSERIQPTIFTTSDTYQPVMTSNTRPLRKRKLEHEQTTSKKQKSYKDDSMEISS